MDMSVNVFSDSSAFTKGGKWSVEKDDLVANFPACKFLLHWDDVSNGNLNWADRVSGVIIEQLDSGGFQKDSLGVRRGALPLIVSGSLPTPGNNDFVLIWSGVIGNATDSIGLGGDYYGVGLSLAGNASGSAALSYTNTRTSAALTPAPTYPLHCMSMHVDNSGDEIRKSGSNSAATQVAASVKAAGGASITGDWPELKNTASNPPNVIISLGSSSGIKIMALMVFSVKPSSTEMAIANKWMAANPGKLYPGFAGRS